MATKKTNINNQNINEWLGSLGYLFPKNSKQLERFDVIFSNYSFELTNHKVDVNTILNKGKSNEKPTKIISLNKTESEEIEKLRMVARKGDELSSEIIEKIKRNQSKLKDEK